MRLLLAICLVSPAASLSPRMMPQFHRSPLPVNRCPITMRIVGAQSNHAGVAMAENTVQEESEATRTQTSRPRKPAFARFERAAASRQAVDVTGALGQAAQLPRPRTLAFAEAGKDVQQRSRTYTLQLGCGPGLRLELPCSCSRCFAVVGFTRLRYVKPPRRKRLLYQSVCH